MSDIISFTGSKIYRFEFGCDEKIYSTQFTGELPPGADTGIIREVRSHLLEESSGIIWSFLEHNHIGYSGFSSGIRVLERGKIMEQAGFLLHSPSCAPVDEWLSEPAFYYASMDCQERITDSHCKGCYFVMKKAAAVPGRMPHYRIIGQTYEDDNGISQGYFAIRENRDNLLLIDIAKSSGEPVLPSFGCVDTLNLLMNISHIETIGQAVEAALC
ncbi:MAG: hypothetical protein NC548_33295 [Lachnospiraceae bacterium]|nr:hypothetical protein [Lachnospiraceae bacterium]